MNNTDMKELVRRHSRRRHPKRHVFLKGMIIYAAIVIILMAVLLCIGWKYASLRDDALPERTIERMIARQDTEYWRGLMTSELPRTYPEYEDGARLADEVLSKVFDIGELTYIKYAARDDATSPTFLIISDGKPMAEVTLRCSGDRLFGLGDWEIDKMNFRRSYFEAEGVEFKTYTISVFEGATLTVNGKTIPADTAEHGGTYPALSRAEESRAADVRCDVYTLEGIYYEPSIRATIGGAELDRLTTADGTVYFAPTDDMIRTVSATVPGGVTVRINGVRATEEWAELTKAEGSSGPLDENGDGSLQVLDVWTVHGLFFDPQVSAEYLGTSLEVLSSDSGNYIFNTPDECRFTLTVLAPHGAAVTVNGKTLTPSATAATNDDLNGGLTLPGLYGVGCFKLLGVTPAFDKYTVSGFLVHPIVSATLDGAELPMANDQTDGYFITCEFDIPDTPMPDEAERSAALVAAAKCAEQFAERYFNYIACGGDMGRNYIAFDAAYGEMLKMLDKNTPAYLRLMEGYAEAYRSGAYSKQDIASTAAAYTQYADGAIGVRIDYELSMSNATETAEAAEATKTTRRGSLYLLTAAEGDSVSVTGFADILADQL